MQYFTVENSKGLALDAVSGSRKLFAILETREISKMAAVSDAILVNEQVRDALAARDRNRLLQVATPLYQQLKDEGITNWMFHTPEPDMSVFLRLHNPPKFGDHLNRFVDKEVVRTHGIVCGNELGKAGFAVRLLRPVKDAKGQVIGYVEFGEELGQFIHTLKNQTGNEYGLLLSKKYMDRRFWADSSAMWNRRDNWDDNPQFVVADKTTADDGIMQFKGDLASVPEEGKVLQSYSEGQSHFIRGIFPINDASGQTVGAMFVVRDISDVYRTMRKTQLILLVVTATALALGIAVLLALLNRFVFRRLNQIILAATRLVGGDFETEIKITTDDEVGKLEQLFEQFRHIFVDVIKQMTAMQVK
jgi:sensor histidine kinase regulating citrate/malate metabolism